MFPWQEFVLGRAPQPEQEPYQRFVDRFGYEPDLSALVPDPEMSDKKRIMIEMFAYLGITAMEMLQKSMVQLMTKSNDLYELQQLGLEDHQDEIDEVGRQQDRTHESFFRQYRFLEKLAMNYFISEERKEKFLTQLKERVPIDEYFTDSDEDLLDDSSDDDSEPSDWDDEWDDDLPVEEDFDSALGSSASDSDDAEREVEIQYWNFYESD